MKRRRLMLALAAAVAAAAAALATVPARAQAPEGRTHALGDFDAIEISGSAVVRFVQGSPDQVFVEGDEAAQRAVELRVRNGLLTINPGGSWKFWNSQRVRVTVTARDLRRLSISGAADFIAEQPVQVAELAVGISGAGLARFDQLRAESLRFSVSGAGDGQIAGSTDQLTVSIAGKSDFRGENLMSQKSRIAVSGIGNVKVWAVQELSVSVSGIGSVDYWGQPQVRRSASGIGTVTARGPRPAAP